MKSAIPTKILSKWLMTTMLIIGFFTFSVPAVSTCADGTTDPITLVVKTKTLISNAVCYRIRKTPNKPLNRHYLISSLINVNQLYSRLVVVNLKIHDSKLFLKPAVIPFYRARSIPQNGADEPAIS